MALPVLAVVLLGVLVVATVLHLRNRKRRKYVVRRPR